MVCGIPLFSFSCCWLSWIWLHLKSSLLPAHPVWFYSFKYCLFTVLKPSSFKMSIKRAILQLLQLQFVVFSLWTKSVARLQLALSVTWIAHTRKAVAGYLTCRWTVFTVLFPYQPSAHCSLSCFFIIILIRHPFLHVQITAEIFMQDERGALRLSFCSVVFYFFGGFFLEGYWCKLLKMLCVLWKYLM